MRLNRPLSVEKGDDMRDCIHIYIYIGHHSTATCQSISCSWYCSVPLQMQSSWRCLCSFAVQHLVGSVMRLGCSQLEDSNSKYPPLDSNTATLV